MLSINDDGAPASKEFMAAVEESYLSWWTATGSMPSIRNIEEDLEDFFIGEAVDKADKNYIGDAEYWNNSDYRSMIIGDYLQAQYESTCFEELEYILIECTKWLNFVAILDDGVDDEDIEYVNTPQLMLIPNLYGDDEEGGI